MSECNTFLIYQDENEFEIYRAREMKKLESDFDRAVKALEMKAIGEINEI
jgi:hypothetical protein